MQHTTEQRPSKFRPMSRRRILTTAAIATLAQWGSTAFGGTTSGEITISTAGSTALKNFITGGQFTDVEPGTTLSIGGVSYPLASQGGAGAWNGSNSFGSNLSLYQLSPKNFASNNDGIADTTPAIRFEYHESGAVEGVLELVNDQIGADTYITQNVNRDPSTISGSGTSALGGNAVWINYSQFGGKGGLNWSATPGVGGGSAGAGNYLGNFYNQSGYTTASPNTFVLGGNAQPVFNASGGNLYGGQNAVQLGWADQFPIQDFAPDNTITTSTTPWTLTPQNSGFGQGNLKLAKGLVGTPGYRAVYQPASYLNMAANASNPRSTTGSTFGIGPWNTAEQGNLVSNLVANTATLFVANPGTGMTQVNRNQAQFMLTTGRLPNGATFNITTRDVNSGTRNVISLNVGLDPTYTVGVNDNGNGNANDGASNQVTIGPGLRFSNKASGGNELRPTVQGNRMAIGTLSINDAAGSAGNVVNGVNNPTANANPIRALLYSDSMDGSAPYVAADYFTIAGVQTSTGSYAGGSFDTTALGESNPNNYSYAIFQNEVAVTVKAPDASYNTSNPNYQGDDSYGDVKALLNNTLGSVQAAFQTSTSITSSPITGLMNNGYIPPQLMARQKAQDGLSTNAASAVTTNPKYNTSGFTSGVGSSAFTNMVKKLSNADPSTVTTGNSSTVYGGNTLVPGGPVGFNSQIPITTTNYLFGNFNQNGVRDYDSVVVEAQKAQAALETTLSGTISALGNSAFTADGGQSNSTTLSSLGITTGVSALDGNTALTKGDLIVLGDYNGDGKFTGKDLYLMAVGASLTSSGSYRPGESGSTFTTGTMNASASTFATSIAGAVINKNVALDYLKLNATSFQKTQAAQVLTGSTNLSSGVPAGATFTGYDSVSGYVQFTYDSAGTNAFNKADVNQDGVVDFNDALLVDSLNGKDYMSLSDSLTSTEQAPVTGVPLLANLVLATQKDVNGDGSAHTVIDSTDVAAINTSLTGSGLTNWYGYQTTKTGPGTITWNRSSSTVNLYTGASLQISSGTLRAITSGTDPFTDNNLNAPGSLTDTSKSLPVIVTTGGTLEYTSNGAGFQHDRLASLNISGGTVTIDPVFNKSNRSILITGSLSISGAVGKLDLGNNDLLVVGGNIANLNALVKSGYAGGSWNGAGISSTAAAANHLTALAVIQNTADGSTTGAALYGSAGTLGSFDGVSPNAADVLVKFTYYGDTDLSGVVDGSDYSKVDYAFTHPALTGWANGDFNYDNVVNGSDYTLLDNAFNTQGVALSALIAATPAAQIQGASTGSSAVPEPASLGLFGLGIGSLLSRRRRRRA